MKVMNPEVKKRWVAALRSGEYVQGNDAMCVRSEYAEDSYCCLGVLADMYCKETGADKGEFFENDSSNGCPRLTDGFKNWAGVTDDYIGDDFSPIVTIETREGTDEISLAELNDSGQTFETLAKLIEEQL